MNDLQLPCRTLFDPPWRTFLYNARALLSLEWYPRETSHGNSYDFSLHDFFKESHGTSPCNMPVWGFCPFFHDLPLSGHCHRVPRCSWTESLLSVSSPKGHSLAVRYIRPSVRSTYCKKDERAERGEIVPNNGRNFRKACNFPILSLSSFHILHFFSFVFGPGGFLAFILVYLLLFWFVWLWEDDPCKWGMRPKKRNRV